MKLIALPILFYWIVNHSHGEQLLLLTDEQVLILLGAGRSSSIGCASAWYAEGRVFNLHVRQSILSLRFGHENISTAILSIALIEEGQLSVTGERMGTKYW